MPNIIRLELPEAVFYLYRQEPGNKITGPWGTGFFVLRPAAKNPTMRKPHLYGISNRHIVAGKIGASIIRVNTKDGKSRMIELDPAEWELAKNGDDIAAVDLTKKVDPNADEVKGIHQSLFMPQLLTEQYQVWIGEDTFMIGLFASHDGGERNVPVVRFGNLAMLASNNAPVELETGAMHPCHLVDTRSRGGFSGSPVFIYRESNADLEWHRYGDWVSGDLLRTSGGSHYWGLLGIHCSQFWEPIEVRKVRKKKSTIEHEPILEGDKLQIQSGITIVIPSWRITDLLDSEVFEMTRRKHDDDDDEAADRRPRPESAESSESNANPNHLADFTRLVDVAARKRPQGDQT